ncbi:MAG: dihydropteroate synthase [Thermoleophilia bacterium]
MTPNPINALYEDLGREHPEITFVGVDPVQTGSEWRFVLVKSDPGEFGAAALGYTSIASAGDETARMERGLFDRNGIPYDAALTLNAIPFYIGRRAQPTAEQRRIGREALRRALALVPELPVVASGRRAQEALHSIGAAHVAIPFTGPLGRANWGRPDYRADFTDDPNLTFEGFLDGVFRRFGGRAARAPSAARTPGRVTDPLAWLTAPCVMGILNVTPDSLWGGSGSPDADTAAAIMERMAADGAVICDVGAESTRPGADPVDAATQLERLAGAFEAMRRAPVPLAVSVDTSLAPVAEAALDAGAVLVNDVTAGRGDPDLLPLVAERGAAVCLMHMRGEPRTMQDDPRYDDVVAEVRDALAERVEAAVAAGVPRERVIVDPGIGFGKTLAHNLALLAGIPALAALGRPVLVGVSRKSMFQALLGRTLDERTAASIGAGLAAVAGGAAVLRVHDVRETADALAAWSAVAQAR